MRQGAGAEAPGTRRHEARSLFGEILDWMLAPLLLLWPMSVMLTWLVAQDIADRPYDRLLGDAAQQLARQVQAEPRPAAAEPPAAIAQTGIAGASDADVRISQLRDRGGGVLSGVAGVPPPGGAYAVPAPGVRFRDAVFDGGEFRVASLWVELGAGDARAGPLLLQLAEPAAKRSRLAAEIIRGVILPQFIVLPLAVLLLWLALSRGIAPLAELQRRIRQRDSSDLSPIDARDVPEELSALVRAINDLLDRLGQSVEVQKHFLADAAHQLKTPLAGLRTQAELAQRSIDGGRTDLQQVRRSLLLIERASQGAAHTVDQLLAMARAENEQQATPRQRVNLGVLAADTVRDFVPLAMEKRIDLGFEGQQATSLEVPGDTLLLRELIRNLVDNALQYTPAGGTATVRVIADPFGQVAVLQVEDSGPGIAAAERELVFQPFYRALGTQVAGSGLGLAIVREIATRHGAEVLLEDANLRHRPGLSDQAGVAFGPGTRFTLRLRTFGRDG